MSDDDFVAPTISILGTAVTSSDADDFRMDPAKVKDQFDRIGCFRVLIMGRSNAGKTTILQRVCNTTELPEVFNHKGEKVSRISCSSTTCSLVAITRWIPRMLKDRLREVRIATFLGHLLY